MKKTRGVPDYDFWPLVVKQFGRQASPRAGNVHYTRAAEAGYALDSKSRCNTSISRSILGQYLGQYWHKFRTMGIRTKFDLKQKS